MRRLVLLLLTGLLVLAGTPAAGAATAGTTAPQAPLVLAGVAGLEWSDLDPQQTPNLWGLVEQSHLGSVSVRTTRSFTCPGEGWLTVGAGRRAVQSAGERPEDAPLCPPLPAVEDGAVVGWAEVLEANEAERYDAQPGLLAETLAPAGCALAVGPGAALALADREGAVAEHVPSLDAMPAGALTRCPVSVVDLGRVALPGFVAPAQAPQPGAASAEVRRGQVREVDRRLGTLLAELPEDASLLLVTLAGSRLQAHLGPAALRQGEAPPGWLHSPSTRRTALVQLTDVLPTVAVAADVPVPDAAVGSPIRAGGVRPAVGAAVEELVDHDVAAVVSQGFLSWFTSLLVVSQLVLYGTAAVALHKRWGGPAARGRVLRATRAGALGFAALPVASYLANLVPWWRRDDPLPFLLLALVGWAVAVAALSLAGPWRRHVLGPPTVVATVTALVLAVDVVRGSQLQLNALLGYSPLVAGRFYGFGNIAFALWASSALLATAGLLTPLVEAGRRHLAGALAALTGLVAVALTGLDRLGTDFGGVIAIVPGFAVLAMGLAGVRITLRRLAASVLGGGLAIAVLAVLDWLRGPAARSHLGDFVQQVLDGEAWTVVERKLAANLGLLLGTPFGLIVPAAVAFLVFVLMRPRQWRAAALQSAYDRAPTLRPALTAIVVALVVGFAVNDSGIVIPAVGLAVAVPLALAAGVSALLRDEEEAARRPAPPPTPSGAGATGAATAGPRPR